MLSVVLYNSKYSNRTRYRGLVYPAHGRLPLYRVTPPSEIYGFVVTAVAARRPDVSQTVLSD